MEGSGPNRIPTNKIPGWQPDRINPNLQRYWDGSEWTAARRWISGQWVDESGLAPDPESGPPGALPTSRYVPQRTQPGSFGTAVQGHATASVTVIDAGLLICSVLVIVGSFTPWLTISVLGHSVGASGTDFSISRSFLVNGWLTLAAGIILFILGCMIVVSAEPFFRTMSLLFSLAAVTFAVYALVRVLQALSETSTPTFDGSTISIPFKPDVNVGWGLIVLLIGALGAAFCAFRETRTNWPG
jgi:hypothetical protein